MGTEIKSEQMEAASKTLMTMLDYLSLDAEVRYEERKEKLYLLVTSEEAGRIIGKKGQSLEAMQLLINRMMQKQDETFPEVVIDIDGYSRPSRDRGRRRDNKRGRRSKCTPEQEDVLAKQALDAAKEVKKWGESVTLPEMNAHERRIVHITLKDDNEVTTDSKGDGPKKSIVITLADKG